MKVYEALARAFAEEDVHHAFALMGDGSMFWQAELTRLGETEIFDVRHEGAGVAMADGYARASGRVGVCAVTCGPGLTQIGTAMMAARKHGSPLVVFAGDVPAVEKRAGGMQDIDQQRYVEAVGGYFQAIRSAATAAEDVQRAFFIAKTERRPVVLNAPMDMQLEEFRGNERYVPSRELIFPRGEIVPDAGQLQKGIEMIRRAERPIIIAGGGAAGCREACEQLGARIGALLATTVRAKGLFDSSEFDLDIAGGYGSRRTDNYLGQADLIVAVGASLNSQTSHNNSLFPNARILQIDLLPFPTVHGRGAADCVIQGDAKSVLVALEQTLAQEQFRSEGLRGTFLSDNDRRDPRQAEIEDIAIELEDDTLDPRQLMLAMDRTLPDDAVIALGAGHFWSFPVRFISGRKSRRFIYSYDFGSISHGMPVAIGASIAFGKRPIFVVEGDASLIMNIQELDTIARYGIPLSIVVMNDNALGAELHKLRAKGLPTAGSDVMTPDLAAIAKGFGIDGVTLRSMDDLANLGPRPKERPILIDAKMSRTVASRMHRRYNFKYDEYRARAGILGESTVRVAVIGNSPANTGVALAADLALAGHDVALAEWRPGEIDFPAIAAAGGLRLAGEASHLLSGLNGRAKLSLSLSLTASKSGILNVF